MTKLLFINASPRDESRSAAVARAYLDAAIAATPTLEVDTIKLWEEPLPDFDGNRANAKLAVITGQDQSDGQKTAWDEITAIAQRFIAADTYVFAVPMWIRNRMGGSLTAKEGELTGSQVQRGQFMNSGSRDVGRDPDWDGAVYRPKKPRKPS